MYVVSRREPKTGASVLAITHETTRSPPRDRCYSAEHIKDPSSEA
jgi:hypothetical protein